MILTNWTQFRTTFATSPTPGPDGVPAWPVSSVRASGFNAGFTGIARPIQAFPCNVSINGGAVDGGAAYDWYLSQRTDTVSLQWLELLQFSPTQSGTVRLRLTAKCVADMGLLSTTDTLNEDQLIEILKHCTLYVQRRSDDAIQLVQLLRYTLSSYG